MTSAQRPERMKIRYCLGVIFFSFLRRHSTPLASLSDCFSLLLLPRDALIQVTAQFLTERSFTDGVCPPPPAKSLCVCMFVCVRVCVCGSDGSDRCSRSRTAAMLVSKVQLLPPFIAFLFDSLQRARVPPTLFD